MVEAMEDRPTQKQEEIGSQSRRERERRVTELPQAVHPPNQEQTLARPFFLVLPVIISP